MSYEVASRILEMLGSADVYDAGLGATLRVKVPEPEGRLITSPIKPPGDPLQVIGATGRLIRHAAELGVFDARPPGIPFDFTVGAGGSITMPATQSRPAFITWGVVVAPGRAFPWAYATDLLPEPGLTALALRAVRDVAREICPLCPQIIKSVYNDAATGAAWTAIKRWYSIDDAGRFERQDSCGRFEWAVGFEDLGAQGAVIVGVAARRFWTGKIWLGEILAGRGDGRGR